MLAGLPVVMFVLPALAGYPVMPGDDHTQNFPLRVLAGSQLRHGHLPLFDPYIWSGAPLLGGWNAGAAYPLTFLFAVLPGVAAWTVNMIVTWWTAGLGTFAFFRASHLSSAASFLGALSFAFAGAMTAQVPHFGLVAGMSWVPVALLASLRLSQRRGLAERLAWIAALAGAIAMVILAGEPRSIDDGVIIIACYAGWRAWRLGRWPQRLAYLAVMLAGVALGAAIGAVQWMPGIEAVSASQRMAHSAFLFDSGSLSLKRLLLSLVPDLLGGSGSFGQPAFLGTYSLNEMTGYVGLMPLTAACALLCQLRWRRLPEWVIWHVVALVGVVLALGGNTPFGHVLAALPFYGEQRLQSRNLVIADFAFAVLFAYWAQKWLGEAPRRRWRGIPARQFAASAPAVAVIGVVIATVTWGAGMLRWLGLSPARAAHAGLVRPWLAPCLVLGGLALALIWWGPRLRPGRRMRVLAGFAAADITVFTLLTVVAVAPGPGHNPAPPATGTSKIPARVVPVGVFTHGGRFAIYDPGLLHSDELPALGVPDSNVISETPSIEGYTSIVDAAYAKATGSHLATGEGQDVLSPQAIGNGTLDQLDTAVLLTLPAYLVTPAKTQGPAHRGPGFRSLAPRQSTTWYFGSLLPVTSLTIPVDGGPGGSGGGVRVGLVRASGSIDWVEAAQGPGSRLDALLPRPQRAVAIRVIAERGRADLGPPAVGTAGGPRYRADGQLQDALVPPRWEFTGFDGAFAIFSDSMAKPPLRLQAFPPGPAAGALVRAVDGPGFAPASAQVSSAHRVTVIRAVADIAGWTATWRPAGKDAVTALPIHRSGLVQAVTVPAGRGTISWSYDPPGARRGLWISLAGLAVLMGAGIAAASSRRRRGRDEAGTDRRNAGTQPRDVPAVSPPRLASSLLRSSDGKFP